jgi:hypothetical protein
MPTHAVKNFVRNRDFYKIASALESGAEHGMWTFQRYRTWLDNRKQWSFPENAAEPPDEEPVEPTEVPEALPKPAAAKAPVEKAPVPAAAPVAQPGTRIEIEPVEGEFGKILKRPE